MTSLLRDHGIKIATKGMHVARGWVNVACPFCGDSTKDKLGWNIADQYFSCWKCRGKRTDEAIAALLKIPEHEAWILMLRYKLRPSYEVDEDAAPVQHANTCIVPGGPLERIHKDYLIGRGYDPDELARIWGLTGTGPLGPYKFRITYPIYYDGRVVSFQGRDVTGKSDLRWKTCDKVHEVRDHKHCLGGAHLVTGDTVAIVEGASDAWRLGPGTVWTFGTSYLAEQCQLMRPYKRRFIILDSADEDPNAAVAADRLSCILSAFPGETHVVELDSGDPGSMVQDEADALMRSIGITK